MRPSRYELDPLEIATGLVIGLGPGLDAVAGSAEGSSPRAALERAVLPALRRSPCLVSFSGGRDSSAILAVATAVARKEGLSLPIPATNLFRAAPSADERDWQERVVSHLGLEDWIRLEHGEDLDCVGPVAADVLSRHGLLWPFNAYFHAPLFRLASGGSLLTGIGGDELLSPSTWSRAVDVLRRRARPEPRDVLRIGLALAPPILRRRVLRSRLPMLHSWLRPLARRTFEEAWTAQSAVEPVGWVAHLAWVRRLRYLQVGQTSLRVLAADDDVSVVHPFLDAGFSDALAQLPARERFGTRGDAMRMFFGDALPADVLARPSKTVFDEVFWSGPSRRFAAGWNGQGVDHDIVDREALASEWAEPQPNPRSFLLLQAAWLTQERSVDRVEQVLDGTRQ
jgi:asparagine synthetase B (glutamine-hydrolysing)